MTGVDNNVKQFNTIMPCGTMLTCRMSTIYATVERVGVGVGRSVGVSRSVGVGVGVGSGSGSVSSPNRGGMYQGGPMGGPSG